MRFPRRSGVLLHPSSLPGSYGIGEIGPAARRFVDTLHGMGQTLWQVLPLGPTSFGNSPYQSPSTFACNPLLISFDALIEEGLLPRARLTDFPLLPAHRVDYGAAIPARFRVLREVCDHFERRATPVLRRRDDYPGLEAFLQGLLPHGSTTFGATARAFVQRFPARVIAVHVDEYDLGR